jgi:PEP-CTERM motif
MRSAVSKFACSGVVVAGLALAGALTGSAEASVITASPSLPLLDVPYTSPTGAGCFPLAGVCVTPGAFTMTSATSVFDSLGQEIDAQAVYDGTLTALIGGAFIATIELTGTVDQRVEGRVSDTELGSFKTDVTGLDMSGAVLGGTLMMGLNPLTPSTGMTSIVALNRGFEINSFFDVFVELSLEGFPVTPLPKITLVAGVPEPSTWAMMLIGFAGLGLAGYRASRKAASVAA